MESKCEIIIFWSAEDDAYVAEVPELPGCMADGNSYQEALSNAEEIIQEWIDTARELGRTVPTCWRAPMRTNYVGRYSGWKS